jgi:rhodanese-related sulfurtransferase
MKQKFENISIYSIEEVLSKNKNNLIILDVRSRKEYEQGHLNGAKNIPFDEIMKEGWDIDNDKIVLVYCSRGGRSMRVANYLSYKGYKVINVVGGINKYNGKNIIK